MKKRDEVMKMSNDINNVIRTLFKQRWTKNLAEAGIKEQRAQLHKNLTDQLGGYWSGHTAYSIMVDGGFLVDSKRIIVGGGMVRPKKLTALGVAFMQDYKARGEL